MGIFEGEEEVLAAPDNNHTSAGGSPDSIHPGHCHRTVYIHAVLGREDMKLGAFGETAMNVRFNRLVDLVQEKGAVLPGILVALVSIIVYLNSLNNGFVWDDNIVILENPVFKNDIISLFFSIDSPRQYEWTPYYRPLTYLTFYLENVLFGFNAFAMHLLNLLLHAANVLLSYVLIYSISGRLSVAFIASILFGVHPIGAESVNFLSGGRNTLLSCLFVLITSLLYVQWVKKDKTVYLVLSSVTFLFAMLSKETGLMLFPLLIIAGLLLRKKEIFYAIPLYLGMLGVYLVLRYSAFKASIVELDFNAELWRGLLNNVYMLPRYLWSVLWPSSISINYPLPEDMNLYALPLLVAWIVISGLFIFILIKGRTPLMIAASGWAVSFWIPTSGIYPIPSMPMADRYIYISIIGIWVIAAVLVSGLMERESIKRFVYIVITIVVILLSVITIKQNTYWRNDFTLFTRYINQYPDNPFGYYNLGTAYLEEAKDIAAAEMQFKKALALRSDFPGLMTQLGHIAQTRRDYEEALMYYNQALMRDPFEVEAIINRAAVFEVMGRYDEALHDYKAFIAFPENVKPGVRQMALEKIREIEERLRR